MRSLEETLRYEHPGVCEKLVELYDISDSEAQELFLETKRWLWLLGKSTDDFRNRGLEVSMGITPSLIMIDQAWHTFIIFTQDYARFCKEYLGEYIHHTPAGGGHFVERDELELRFHYICEHLGRKTLIKWYSEYQEKYGNMRIKFQAVSLATKAPDTDITSPQPARLS